MTKTGLIAAAALPLAGLAAATAAQAAETIRYGYDARGRLVRVERSGPVNKVTAYAYDKANNRTRRTTTP